MINYEGQITCAYTNAKVLIYRYKNALNMKLSFLSSVVTMAHIYDNTKTFRYHVKFVLIHDLGYIPRLTGPGCMKMNQSTITGKMILSFVKQFIVSIMARMPVSCLSKIKY